MSISSEVPRRVSLTASAGQVLFNFTNVLILEADDLDVYQNGVLLNIGPDYSVSLNGDAPSDGTVTLAVGASSGDSIVIESQIQITQPTVYNPGTAFPAQSHEEALDRQAIISSDIAQRLRRVPLWDAVNNLNTELHLNWSKLDFPSLTEPKIPIYDPVSQTVLWGDVEDLGVVDFSAITGTLDISGADPRILPITVGTDARTLSQHLGDWVKTCDYGLLGDDVTDDTLAFQAALDAAEDRILLVCKPDVAYRVGPLFVRNRTTLWFEPGVVIHARGSLGVNDRLLNITDVDDVVIHGNMALLDMEGQFTTGEQRHGVFARGTTRLRIHNFHAKGCGGDGFYLGNGPLQDWCEDTELRGCVATENRRQGLSIVSVDKCLVQGGVYQRTGKGPAGGTSPMSGIDIEANTSADRIRGVRISDVLTYDNASNGIVFPGIPFNDDVGPIEVSIENHHSLEDLVGFQANILDNSVTLTEGWVRYNNGHVYRSTAGSIIVRNWDADGGVRVEINNPVVINTNVQASGSAKFGAAIQVIKEIGDLGSAPLGNVVINNPVLRDTRATGLMQSGIYIEDADGNDAKNIEINNPNIWWADATFMGAFNGIRFNGAGTINDPNRNLVRAQTFGAPLGESTGWVLFTNEGAVASVIMDLNTTYRVGYPDLIFEVVEPVQFGVRVDGTERLLPLGGDGGVILSQSPGSRVRLRKTSATQWAVVEKSGWWEYQPASIETDSVSHTGDTVETTLETFSLKANQLFGGSKVILHAYGFIGGANSVKTLRWRLGASVITAIVTAITPGDFTFHGEIDVSTTTSQRVNGWAIGPNQGESDSNSATLAEDLTTALDIDLTIQLADAADSISVISASCEIVQRKFK